MMKHVTDSAHSVYTRNTLWCLNIYFVFLTAVFFTFFSLLTFLNPFMRVILFLHFHLYQSPLVCQLSSHWHLFWGGAPKYHHHYNGHHTAPFEREIKSFKEGRNEAGGKTIQKLNLTSRWMHYSGFFLPRSLLLTGMDAVIVTDANENVRQEGWVNTRTRRGCRVCLRRKRSHYIHITPQSLWFQRATCNSVSARALRWACTVETSRREWLTHQHLYDTSNVTHICIDDQQNCKRSMLMYGCIIWCTHTF